MRICLQEIRGCFAHSHLLVVNQRNNGFLVLNESWSAWNLLYRTESFYRSEDKMGLISYLGWVVIAELNHLTVFHTGGSHSWIGFIMCHCSWLRLDCQCSVWEWFHGKCEPSVDLSHSPHRDTEIFQLGISRELNSYHTACQHTWQDMMRL